MLPLSAIANSSAHTAGSGSPSSIVERWIISYGNSPRLDTDEFVAGYHSDSGFIRCRGIDNAKLFWNAATIELVCQQVNGHPVLVLYDPRTRQVRLCARHTPADFDRQPTHNPSQELIDKIKSTAAFFFLAFLIFAGPANATRSPLWQNTPAQNLPLPHVTLHVAPADDDPPHAGVLPTAYKTTTTAMVHITALAAPPTSLFVMHQDPVPRPKNATRIWLAETFVLGGLYASDATLTANRATTTPEGHSFFYGRQPSPQRISLQIGGLFALQSLTLHFTEHSRHKWIRWAGRAWFGFSVADETDGIRSWR